MSSMGINSLVDGSDHLVGGGSSGGDFLSGTVSGCSGGAKAGGELL